MIRRPQTDRVFVHTPAWVTVETRREGGVDAILSCMAGLVLECGFPVAAHLSVGCIRILLVLVVDGVS